MINHNKILILLLSNIPSQNKKKNRNQTWDEKLDIPTILKFTMSIAQKESIHLNYEVYLL